MSTGLPLFILFFKSLPCLTEFPWFVHCSVDFFDLTQLVKGDCRNRYVFSATPDEVAHPIDANLFHSIGLHALFPRYSMPFRKQPEFLPWVANGTPCQSWSTILLRNCWPILVEVSLNLFLFRGLLPPCGAPGISRAVEQALNPVGSTPGAYCGHVQRHPILNQQQRKGFDQRVDTVRGSNPLKTTKAFLLRKYNHRTFHSLNKP